MENKHNVTFEMTYSLGISPNEKTKKFSYDLQKMFGDDYEEYMTPEEIEEQIHYDMREWLYQNELNINFRRV